jgi:hypothetical protein
MALSRGHAHAYPVQSYPVRSFPFRSAPCRRNPAGCLLHGPRERVMPIPIHSSPFPSVPFHSTPLRAEETPQSVFCMALSRGHAPAYPVQSYPVLSSPLPSIPIRSMQKKPRRIPSAWPSREGRAHARPIPTLLVVAVQKMIGAICSRRQAGVESYAA